MKILVTGATGFCGHHLCQSLIQAGHTLYGTILEPIRIKKSPVKLLPCDLTDENAVSEVVRTSQPEAIFHLAAQSSPSLSWKHPDKTFQVNTLGTIHLLNAMRRHMPNAKMIYASTLNVYGEKFRSSKILTENDPPMPTDPYSGSKRLAELACLNFVSCFGLSIVIARPCNQVGRGQADHFVFSNWCTQIAHMEGLSSRSRILQVGNLKVERDFLHIQDAVSAYQTLLCSGIPGQIYNICSGNPTSLEVFISYLQSISKIPWQVRIQAERVRKNEIQRICASSARIRHLGWKPSYNVLQALDDLLSEKREMKRSIRKRKII